MQERVGVDPGEAWRLIGVRPRVAQRRQFFQPCVRRGDGRFGRESRRDPEESAKIRWYGGATEDAVIDLRDVAIDMVDGPARPETLDIGARLADIETTAKHQDDIRAGNRQV